MSYISCVNSAILPPFDYPTGAVGSIITPVLNSVAVADGVAVQTIPNTTLPQGVWLVSGVLFFDSVTGGQTLVGETSITVDGISRWRSSNPVTTEDGVSISLSYCVESNGTNVLAIPAVYTTSGGANYALVTVPAPLSLVQVIRIA